MTTSITVNALHGLDVDVFSVTPDGTGNHILNFLDRVPAGTSRVFTIYKEYGLMFHEVQLDDPQP